MTKDIVLVESRSAREDQMASMSHDRAQGILEKVKGILFALWKGQGVATTSQMAEFYQVPEDTVQSVIKGHRDEFNADGLKVLSGKALRDVVSFLDTSSSAPKLTVWTPRAALRLGMLLRDSPVAVQVRTTLLNLVEHGIPAQNNRIRELELESKIFESKQKLLAQTQMLKAGGMGEDLIAAVLAPTSQIVHVPGPEVTVSATVDNKGRVVNKTKTVSAATVARRCGAKNGSSLVDWLISIGRDDLLETSAKVVAYPAIKSDAADTVAKLWRANGKAIQMKVGESV
jgi:hypothetical protein